MEYLLELQTKVPEDYTITEQVPTRGVGVPISCLHTVIRPVQHNVLISVLNVKVIVSAFNQEKSLIGAFSVSVKSS